MFVSRFGCFEQICLRIQALSTPKNEQEHLMSNISKGRGSKPDPDPDPDPVQIGISYKIKCN